MDAFSTDSIKIPDQLIDQVVGQSRAVEIVRLAVQQRRFLLLIGEPGTGKSLLGKAVAQLLPSPTPNCIVSMVNEQDPCCPHILIRSYADILNWKKQLQKQAQAARFSDHYFLAFIALAIILVSIWVALRDQAYAYLLTATLGLLFLWKQRPSLTSHSKKLEPKILHQLSAEQAPFIDATACSEGALFGDIRHDPYQSGGWESPPHQLIEIGAIHRAHGGVLYLDEIASLSALSQKLLLTAIQDKALPITGRQSGSSGTLIRTAPIPCDFVLVAAGNQEDLEALTPALRSRILGYGYEVLTQSTMLDNEINQQALIQFIAQEVNKDGRIPHFDGSAVQALLNQARLRAGEPGRLTARLRELGGLIRIAGDLAVRAGHRWVSHTHVEEGLSYASSIEQQRADHLRPS